MIAAIPGVVELYPDLGQCTKIPNGWLQGWFLLGFATVYPIFLFSVDLKYVLIVISGSHPRGVSKFSRPWWIGQGRHPIVSQPRSQKMPSYFDYSWFNHPFSDSSCNRNVSVINFVRAVELDTWAWLKNIERIVGQGLKNGPQRYSKYLVRWPGEILSFHDLRSKPQ